MLALSADAHLAKTLDRLTLRNWTEADVAPFLAHTNTPAVMRWLGGVTPEPEASERLRQRIIPWQEQRGFTFRNPNAVKTCGCGHSFQA